MSFNKAGKDEAKAENLEDDEDYIRSYSSALKICFIGKSFVGKTQLINRIVNNHFFEEYEPTLDEQIYRTTYRTKDGKFLELILEDLFPFDLPTIN